MHTQHYLQNIGNSTKTTHYQVSKRNWWQLQNRWKYLHTKIQASVFLVSKSHISLENQLTFLPYMVSFPYHRGLLVFNLQPVTQSWSSHKYIRKVPSRLANTYPLTALIEPIFILAFWTIFQLQQIFQTLKPI